MKDKKSQDKDRYAQRGVSSEKLDVHNAIKNLSQGIFPDAFCKILPDVLGGNKKYCNISHADGAGTKSALAYVYWRETGDLSVWCGIAQDALVMNLDDMFCAGAGLHDEEFLYSLSIDRNKDLVPGEVIAAIIQGTQEFIDSLARLGVVVHLAGGETADVGDLVRTITVNGTMTTRMKRENVIHEKLISKSAIVAFASYGQSTYENAYNSGIRSNGLTSARHDLFVKAVGKKYPESFNPLMDPKLAYCGTYGIIEPILQRKAMDMGKFVLSPTRTYAPILKAIFNELKSLRIDGLIHCSGGGLTKVLKFIPDDVSVVKNNLFPTPKLFSMIQKESGTKWQEMFKTFNMGHGLEIYCNKLMASKVVEVAQKFNVDAKIIGYCERMIGKAKLVISSSHGEFSYS